MLEARCVLELWLDSDCAASAAAHATEMLEVRSVLQRGLDSVCELAYATAAGAKMQWNWRHHAMGNCCKEPKVLMTTQRSVAMPP